MNLNFGTAGGLPTTVEELAFINNFLIKLGEQIATGEYYGAGIPPPTAAAAAAAAAVPPSISMSAPPAPATQFANTIPYMAALGAAGLGLGATGLGAATAGGIYDPALLAHLGLAPGLGLHFPITSTPQQQHPSPFANGNTGAGANHVAEYPASNGTAGSGSLYPSLFPQQPQHHASSSSSVSPSGSPPLDASVLTNGVLGMGHPHAHGKGGNHHRSHPQHYNAHHPGQQRSPSGTPEIEFDYDYSDVLSGTTAASHADGGAGSLGSGPPQKRTSSIPGGGSKRSRLDRYTSSPSQQQQPYYGDMAKEEHHDSPVSSASARSSSLRHSHSPSSADQHDFVIEQQQERQRQALNNNGAAPAALEFSHLLGPAFAGNLNVNAAMLSALGLGGVGGLGGAGVSDAAKREHVPRMGTYEFGSTKPLVHTTPKVQTSVSASSASRPTITVVKTEERDDEQDDYIRPVYSSSSRGQDADSDGEPLVGRLRRIRVPPPPASITPSPVDRPSGPADPALPTLSLSLPSSSSFSTRPSHSRSSSSSFSPSITPLPSYPTLDASLKLPALRNVSGATGDSGGPRRSSKASISSFTSISASSSSSRSTVSPGTTPRMGSTRSFVTQDDGDEDESDHSDREDQDQEMRDADQRRWERVTLPGVSSILAAAAAGRDMTPPAGHVDHIMGDLRGIALRSTPTTPHLTSLSFDSRSPKSSASKLPSPSASSVVREQRRAHAELIGRLLVFINAEFAKRHPAPGTSHNIYNNGKSGSAGNATKASRTARTAKSHATATHSPVSSEDEDEEDDDAGEPASRRRGMRTRSLRRSTSSSYTAKRATYRSSSRRIRRGDEDDDEDEDVEDDNDDGDLDRSRYSRGPTPQSLYPDLRVPIQMHRQVYAQ